MKNANLGVFPSAWNSDVFSMDFLWIFSEFFDTGQLGILALHQQVLQGNLITYTVFQPRAHFTAYFENKATSYDAIMLLPMS